MVQAEKYALIFAIGDYPNPELNGWPKISANNDAEYLKRALSLQGFRDERIKVISDAAATKQGIIRGITDLSYQIRQNDIVLIHFSCHGVQIEDPNEPDGFSEAIVPFGARYTEESSDPAAVRSQYITDDEIGILLSQISAKIGNRAEFIISFDVGYSGYRKTGSVIDGARGGNPPIRLKDHHLRENNPNPFNTTAEYSLTFIQACSAEETAYETYSESGKKIGTLTYALSNTLVRLSKDETYRGFTDKIQLFISERNPYQHAQINSNSLDRVIFGGSINESWPFVEVKSVGPDFTTIAVGRSKGVCEGSTVEFYRAGALPLPELRNAFLGRGVVIKASDFSCQVKTDSALTLNPEDIWVFLKEVKYGKKTVRLKVTDENIKSIINSNISRFDNLILVEQDPELVLAPLTAVGESDDIQNGNRSMENVALYKADNGMQYAPLEVSEDFIWELNQKINAFGKAYFIRYLQNKSKNISVDLAFTYYKNGTVDSEKTENARKGLDRVLYEGDSVKISVRNNGNRPAYITILDIQPDDKINFIVPNVRQALMPNDYFVNPGETLNIPNFITMYPPYGREVFKLFASEEPVSFESILSDAIVSTRGFFQKTEIQLEDYTILDYAFEIKKKPFGAATSGKNSDGSSFYLTDRHGNIKTQQVHRQDTLYLNAGIDFQSKLYFNVLTLDQAQNVSVAYPANAFSEEHCILEAGPEFQLKYPVSVPAGNYVKYFVVSSDKPFDLRGYFASGENPRASLSELLISEKLPNRSLQDISCTSYFYTISESREDEVTRAGNDPVIEILTPQAEGNSKGAGVAQENTGMINISGFASTEDQRPVKEVRLNGQSVFYNANRQFFRVENYALAEGENRILIEAITDEGLKVSKILSFYIKPATEITKSSGKNYFVGIGINTYGCCGYDNLNNATRDVLDIADVMKNKYSFRPEDVILLLNEDATRSKIYRTLRDLVPLIDTNDKVFIYLSGHGNKDQIAQGGYFFIPSDISKDERGIVDESSLLSEDDILKPFKAYRARHSLLVVDACYSGLMVNPSSYGNDDGPVYNDIEKDPSKWIITSGRAEKVSDGTPGANSPFASVLISYLRNQKPGDAVQVSVLSNELQTNVKKVSNQTPLGMPVSGTGQFVFHAN